MYLSGETTLLVRTLYHVRIKKSFERLALLRVSIEVGNNKTAVRRHESRCGFQSLFPLGNHCERIAKRDFIKASSEIDAEMQRQKTILKGRTPKNLSAWERSTLEGDPFVILRGQ